MFIDELKQFNGFNTQCLWIINTKLYNGVDYEYPQTVFCACFDFIFFIEPTKHFFAVHISKEKIKPYVGYSRGGVFTIV